jgi:hypothetical protein
MVGIVSLEVVEEDGVVEMPIITGQIAVGVCGTHILACWVFVMAMAALGLEGFLADAAILYLPKLILLLGCQDGQFVLAEISISFKRTILDVQHILLHESMDRLVW